MGTGASTTGTVGSCGHCQDGTPLLLSHHPIPVTDNWVTDRAENAQSTGVKIFPELSGSAGRPHPSEPSRRRVVRLIVVAVLAAAVAAAAVLWLSTDTARTDRVPVSQVLADARAGKLTTAQLDDPARTVTVTTTYGSSYQAWYPVGFGADLTTALTAAKVSTSASPPPPATSWLSVFLAFAPIMIIVGALVWLVKSSSLTSLGKFAGRRGDAVGEVPTTTFADVAGADEAVEQLREMVEFLQDESRFTAVGATPSRGALLVGPPGTGKTLLARAVAGEAGVPFFALAGSDFVEVFAGLGAKRVRGLFDKARAVGRGIIFIDEIDAIGRARSPMNMGGDAERESTLLSILNEIDGFHSTAVVVIAATNRADVLDEALTRPGRLERRIEVPLPDRRGREEILAVHARSRPFSDDVDFASLARRTPGMAGAELARLINESCLEAARRGATTITSEMVSEALATVALGKARTSAMVSESDREITAWHESGHMVVALLSEECPDPVSVSITPRGPAGGVTWLGGDDDVFVSRSRALAQLRVSLAGRAAEKMLLDGDYTSGAHGDLAAATRLGYAMVTSYGMTSAGLACRDETVLAAGGELLATVDAHVCALLDTAEAQARALLDAHRGTLERVAAALLDEETLTVDQVRDLVT